MKKTKTILLAHFKNPIATSLKETKSVHANTQYMTRPRSLLGIDP